MIDDANDVLDLPDIHEAYSLTDGGSAPVEAYRAGPGMRRGFGAALCGGGIPGVVDVVVGAHG